MRGVDGELGSAEGCHNDIDKTGCAPELCTVTRWVGVVRAAGVQVEGRRQRMERSMASWQLGRWRPSRGLNSGSNGRTALLTDADP